MMIEQALSFLYPYGATLNVARPATAVLSTGSVSFPQVLMLVGMWIVMMMTMMKMMMMKMMMMMRMKMINKNCALQDRPVLALYQHPGQQGGKLAVVGSAAMLRLYLLWTSLID